MLKYLALLKVDQPKLWSNWHSSPTEKYFKSHIETDRSTVEKWLSDELAKYPNARIDESGADRDYLIRTAIIAFDEEESNNLEAFFNNFIHF